MFVLLLQEPVKPKDSFWGVKPNLHLVQYLIWNHSQGKCLGKIVRGQKVYINFPAEYSPSLQQPVTRRCIFAAHSSSGLLFNEFPTPFWHQVNPSHYTFPLHRPTAEPPFGGGPSVLPQLPGTTSLQGLQQPRSPTGISLPWIPTSFSLQMAASSEENNVKLQDITQISDVEVLKKRGLTL